MMMGDAEKDPINDRDFSDLKVLLPGHRQQRS